MVIWAFLTKRQAIHHVNSVSWDRELNSDNLIRDLLYTQRDCGCQHGAGTFWNKVFTPGWPFVQHSFASGPCIYLPSDCHGEGPINMDAFSSRPWCNFRNRSGFIFLGEGGVKNVQVGIVKSWTNGLGQGCFSIYIFFFIFYGEPCLFISVHSLCHYWNVQKIDGWNEDGRFYLSLSMLQLVLYRIWTY